MSELLVLINARVFTGSGVAANTDDVFCDCMVVKDEQIYHVGRESDKEVRLALEQGAKVKDLKDRVVASSFIDGHAHLLLFGLSLRKLDLSTCKTYEQIRDTITTYAKENPDIPRLLCRGWLQPSTDGLALASMLDDLDPRPIFVEALDLHSSWCNTAALNELNIDDEKIALHGHGIQKDDQNKPTGLIAEGAQFAIIWPHLTKIRTPEEEVAALDEAFSSYIDAGYTGAVDMVMDPATWEAMRRYRESKGIPIHIGAHWYIEQNDDLSACLAQVDEAIEMNYKWHPSTSRDFCIVGIKIVADGVVDGCTAALSHPYAGTDSIVHPLWSADILGPVVRKASDAGLQVAVHAIGDLAITQAIDAIAATNNPLARHRIEHLELATAADAKRLATLGITASIQPVHSDPVLLKAYPALIGPRAWERAFPYAEFLHTCVAIGTDAPTARHLPLPNLYNASTRKSALDPELEEQIHIHYALSLSQSLVAATSGAAYSRFADSWTGSLKKGQRADFVVLDTQWTPETLLEAEVRETWAGGKLLFEAK